MSESRIINSGLPSWLTLSPVEAIFYEDDVPDEWEEYYKANVEFFDDLGSPGGAAKLGNTGKDHPIISALPPQNHDD